MRRSDELLLFYHFTRGGRDRQKRYKKATGALKGFE
jgi:hypothetical protein